MGEGGDCREQQELAWLTVRQLAEFKQLEKPKFRMEQDHSRPNWSRPLYGRLKINVDGGFSKECAQGS